ncbi:DUF1801 domain-containing protein [Vibrio jasicida]|uniref:DUF1801 domain-containing protein n=1 Tax=Vibrio jasicida TaxID=766224 RepID=UPI000694FC77|nr:DUF1801 domain-containing protein [Vibrio jasicida]
MMIETDSQIENLLSDFKMTNLELFQVITELRKTVKESLPTIEEAVKYGGLVFLKEGELLGGIFLRKAFVTMEFSFGNELQDPNNLLEGTGKFRRNIKFRNLDDIDTKLAKYYIEQVYT